MPFGVVASGRHEAAATGWSHPDLVGAWDAQTLEYAAGAEVLLWPDSSPTAQDMTGTMHNGPRYRAAGGPSGLPAVEFIGFSFLGSGVRPATSMTWALVRNVQTGGNTVQAWNGLTSGGGPLILDGLRAIYGRASSLTTDGPAPLNVWERWVLTMNSAGRHGLWVNGVRVIDASVNPMSPAVSGYARLGASDNSGENPEFVSGAMLLAEAHLYDTDLGAADVAALDAYLAVKWGM